MRQIQYFAFSFLWRSSPSVLYVAYEEESGQHSTTTQQYDKLLTGRKMCVQGWAVLNRWVFSLDLKRSRLDLFQGSVCCTQGSDAGQVLHGLVRKLGITREYLATDCNGHRGPCESRPELRTGVFPRTKGYWLSMARCLWNLYFDFWLLSLIYCRKYMHGYKPNIYSKPIKD